MTSLPNTMSYSGLKAIRNNLRLDSISSVQYSPSINGYSPRPRSASSGKHHILAHDLSRDNSSSLPPVKKGLPFPLKKSYSSTLPTIHETDEE
mmetsp:Transcript_3545/g.6207  ORF Transcript_3545/g.6207 Transcript_3545/m.6207 type:complete len:93 (-) Transcript_3545:106-384(-)